MWKLGYVCCSMILKASSSIPICGSVFNEGRFENHPSAN